MNNSANNVETNYNHYFRYLYNDVSRMLVFEGLPETVNVDYFKRILLLEGNICLTQFNGEWYACYGAIGGNPNEYYLPELYIIANPILGSKEVKIDKDGVVIFLSSDDKFINSFNPITKKWEHAGGGLRSLIEKTASILAHCLSTLTIGVVNTRATNLFSVPDDVTKKSVDVLYNDIYKGELMKAISNSFDLNTITSLPMTVTSYGNTLKEVVEIAQYYLANFYHAIGINSNYNLKRERLIESEIGVNQECLRINITDILQTVTECLDKFNAKTGLKVTVRLGDEWQKVEESEVDEDESKIDITGTSNDDDDTIE